MKSRRRVNSTVMLLSPSLKRIGFTVAVVFVLAGFVTAQTSRHRKRAKRSKTLVTCSHHTSQGTLCGPPVTLVTNADAVPKNTVTVQVTIDETGNVVSARAVAGNPTYFETAVANAKQQKFTPKRLGGKLVKVDGIIIYKFENP
jgi:hypothetical protein